MVKTITLKAETRTKNNGQAKAMLKNDIIPGVLYGAGIANKLLKLKRRDFENVFREAGETHLLNLEVDGKENFRVLIKDVQRDNIKSKIIHVDFYQVDMSKKIEVEVPLHFVGESKAVKELNGTLVKSLNSLHIRCLPSDLIDKIDVDISVLETYDNAVHVSDLRLPENIEVLNNLEDIVAHVMAPTVEEAPVPAAAEGEAAGLAESESAVSAGSEAAVDSEKKD